MNSFETCKHLLHHLLDDLESLETTVPDFSGYAKLCLRAALEDDDLPILVDFAWQKVLDQLQKLCTECSLTLVEALKKEAISIIWTVANQVKPTDERVIRTLYFVYTDELDKAYQDAEIYYRQPNNYEQVCIRLYLEHMLWQRSRKLLKQSQIAPS